VLSGIAYDDKHNVYLVTWEADRQIWARFHDASGNPLGVGFPIASLLQSFAGVPKVAYSRGSDDDVFLIVFSSDAMIFDRSKNIFGQFIRYTGQGATGASPVGGNFDISQNSRNAAFIQTAFDVTYNVAVKHFLVGWDERVNNGPADAMVRAFTTTGQPVSGDVNVNLGLNRESQGATTVSVTPAFNKYIVAWQGDHPTQPVIGLFAAILDGNSGAPIAGANFIELTRGGFPIEPAAMYLPDRQAFLVMWTQMSGTQRWVEGRLVGVDGVPIGGVYTLMQGRSEGAPDSVFHAGTRTTLISAMSNVKLIRGVELNQQGQPTTAPYNLSTVPSVLPGDAGGSFNPHVVAGANGTFGLAYTIDFRRTLLEVYQGAAGGNPPPPPPPPVNPVPRMFLDSPATNSLVQPSFAVAGWAVDLGSPAGSGTGMSTVHVWAFPTNGGAATFLGAATMGIGRPDIAAHFQRSDFANAGWVLNGSLTAGSYDVVAFAFSTVAGNFAAAAGARITVVNAASQPKMFVDSPGNGQIVSTSFAVGGWAVDLGASAGCGVAAVHVWAYPSSGAPIFVGAAGPTVWRPDVAAHFGDGRWGASGYSLQGTLPPGAYTLVVFAFSTVTGSFNQAAAVPITVR
jgi:hypothetical protein